MEIEQKVLNRAFELGLEFGKNWLVSTEKRIEEEFPQLTQKSKEYLDKHIDEIRHYGIQLVNECINGSKNENEAFEKLDSGYSNIMGSLSNKSPNLSKENLEKIYSQSVYYSRK